LIQSAVLFGTSGCHLCDTAFAIISPILLQLDVELTLIDIAGSDTLEERYGVRIPVLVFNGKELGWPFEAADVERLLAT